MSDPSVESLRAEFRKQRRNAVIGYVTLLIAVLFVFVSSQNDTTDARQAIVNSGKVVSVEGCNRDFQTIEKVRGAFDRAQVLLEAQHAAGVLDEKQYQESSRFYRTQLASFPLPDCRGAGDVITADPRKVKYPPPYPLYPAGQ